MEDVQQVRRPGEHRAGGGRSRPCGVGMGAGRGSWEGRGRSTGRGRVHRALPARRTVRYVLLVLSETLKREVTRSSPGWRQVTDNSGRN